MNEYFKQSFFYDKVFKLVFDYLFMVFAETFLMTMALPFLLIFVIVFAVLEKSKLFGENKHQINSLLGLVVGLILIGFPVPRDIVVAIMPWVAVGAATMLVFFILYGFVGGDLSEEMPKSLKIVFGSLAGLFTLLVVIFTSGLDDIIAGWLNGGENVLSAVFVIVLVVGAVLWAVLSNGVKKKED